MTKLFHGLPVIDIDPVLCRTCQRPSVDVLIEDPNGNRRYLTGEVDEKGELKEHIECDFPKKEEPSEEVPE